MLSGDAVGERINQAHWKRGRDHVMLSEDAVGERHYESEDVVMSC